MSDLRTALANLVAAAEKEPGAGLDGSDILDAIADAYAALESPKVESAAPIAGVPVGHLHSNGDWCQDYAVASEQWPIPLYAAPIPPQAAQVQAHGQDERDAFEAWYVDNAICQIPDLQLTVEEMRGLRDGDGYGAERHRLNGKWEGWQARAAMKSTQPTGGDGGRE